MFENIDLSWAPPVLAMFSIVGVLAAMIRWLVKHYFEEIKKEFKPNGGSSLKDQVNRLESDHRKLYEKIDQMEEKGDAEHKELANKIDKVYTTIIHLLKDK
jgi:3-methyladenine DNA glycosylase AlkD